MKFIATQSGITKIAMPIIGCGLDRLQWDRVSEIIKEVFKNTDIEILVCKQ
jgi:O-acetyl-ADP-ribose deacetylase (regulator of RNase III)